MRLKATMQITEKLTLQHCHEYAWTTEYELLLYYTFRASFRGTY